MPRQRDNYHHSPASRASGRHRSRSYSPGYQRDEGHCAYTSYRRPHANDKDIRHRPNDTIKSRQYSDHYNDHYNDQHNNYARTHQDNGSRQSCNRNHHNYPERFHSHHDECHSHQSYPRNNRDVKHYNEQRYD